jgi:hypothetical protein
LKKIIAGILAVIFAQTPLQAQAEKLCGPHSVQTVWLLSPQKSELKLKAKKLQKNSPFCEISVDGSNAEVFLLDSKKVPVRSYRTFISMDINQDFKSGSKEAGTFDSLASVVVQLRFVDNEEFKTVKFVKVTQPNGKIYGPVAL